ncbi:MAG: acetylornithine/succinylornithine family transaminase [Ignavibacteriaceae bacterium]
MEQNIFEKEKQLFLNTYKRIPIEIQRGEGVHLIDKKGNKYLDLFSGLGVNALGHAHPKIVEAVSNQITKFGHLSNNYICDVQIEFAELLLKHSKMSKVFLTNSGGESIEGAIKLIRKKYGPDKKIFSLTNSFHGRTYAAMTLTEKGKYKKGFEPLVPNIYHINFNDVKDLQGKIDSHTAAIFVEFIQGEGGINILTKEFVEKLTELKNKFGFAIAADEIQCGIGRTGNPFSHNYFDLNPDIILSAKAIGGGLPLGAILTSQNFDRVFEPGMHGTTFGGNPVSCAAGKVVLTEVFENGLMENAADLGKYLIEQLNELKKLFTNDIKEIRGKGLMIGIDLFYDGNSFVEKMRERKVLINCTNETVLRLLPPLIVDKSQIDFFLYNFHEVLKEKN